MKSNLVAGIAAGCLFALISSADAETFYWTYTGTPCTEAVCGFGPDVFPPQAMAGSGHLTTGATASPHGQAGYSITDFSGTWNGFAITGLLPTDPSSPFYFFNDNVLYFPDLNSPNFRYLDFEGLGFSVADGTGVNLFWSFGGGPYFAFASATPPYGFTDFTGGSFGSFTVQAVPGPIVGGGLSGLLLAGGGLLGWWRKRKANAAAA